MFLTSTTHHGVFSDGNTLTRNYYIRFPSGKDLSFGYAVLADWTGQPGVPANAPEAMGLDVSRRGTFVVDGRTMATNLPGVYAGGDVSTGPGTVIEAMSDGALAA